MKVLSIFAEKFSYKTTSKTIESMPNIDEQKVYENVLVGFIQTEKKDEKDSKYIKTKLVKNLKWVLDFNKAYNPWCAYSENYACPFTPPENWLDVPLYAGEKDFKK